MSGMVPKIPLRTALADENLLGSVLGGDSWFAWRVILLAAMGEPLTDDELRMFTRLTGRAASPSERVDELVCVVGRRGGKSTAMAALGVYIACLCQHRLNVGETGVVLLIAPNQRQAKVALDYMSGMLEAMPLLRHQVVNRTAEAIELKGRINIEVRSASFRRLRGLTTCAVIADEAAFWHDSEFSSNPDSEIFNAVRPSLALTGGPLIIISSPYSRKGEVWETYSRHFGEKGNPRILVAQGASRDFNVNLPQSVVDRALERDEAAAKAEYLGIFRTDVEDFVNLEAVRSCIQVGVRERAPDRSAKYFGFVDPSGGSSDSYCCAVAHKLGETVILDAIREAKPPFSPEGITEEFASLMKAYRISKCFGDRYAGEWPREQFRKFGLNYEPSAKSKSELYIDLLPLINSRAVDLLDNSRLVNQLVGLERRTSRGGRDLIDSGAGRHEDLANAAAGAIVLAFEKRAGGFSSMEAARNLPAMAHIARRDGSAPPPSSRFSPRSGPPAGGRDPMRLQAQREGRPYSLGGNWGSLSGTGEE